MAASENTKWLRASIALAVAAVSASAAISGSFQSADHSPHTCFVKSNEKNLISAFRFVVLIFRRKSRDLNFKVRELEISLEASLEKCAAERQGRIRAHQVHFTLYILHLHFPWIWGVWLRYSLIHNFLSCWIKIWMLQIIISYSLSLTELVFFFFSC